MIFHIVGVACMVGGLATTVPGHNLDLCAEYENPQDYASDLECSKHVDLATPLPAKVIGGRWIVLHCMQQPNR